jgi:hypothetical protein
LTFFHDDHVQVGAAAAEAASDSTIDVDLTMILETIEGSAQALAISWKETDVFIYGGPLNDST